MLSKLQPVHLQLVNLLSHVPAPLPVYSPETYVVPGRKDGLYIALADDGIPGVYPRDELGVWNLTISLFLPTQTEAASSLVFLASASSRVVVSAF